ncbi:MAG: hypothetical protein LEGION0403_FIIPPAGN_02418 [Legionella sp.]
MTADLVSQALQQAIIHRKPQANLGALTIVSILLWLKL